MFAALSSSPDDAKTPAIFIGTLVFFIAAAMVPTLWTDLDLWVASFFSGPTPAITSVQWPWVVLINDWVPAVFRVMLLCTLVGWLGLLYTRRRRGLQMTLAFFCIAGFVGPGAVVNLVFKDHWQRARPYQVEAFGGDKTFTRAAVITDQCDANCSFVSGHVACGVFFISLALVHRRRKLAWVSTGVAAGLAIGFARISDSAHWLSDVLWAFPITLVSSWLVWKLLCRAYGVDRWSPSRTVG